MNSVYTGGVIIYTTKHLVMYLDTFFVRMIQIGNIFLVILFVIQEMFLSAVLMYMITYIMQLQERTMMDMIRNAHEENFFNHF